jgi:hypothetical protein
LHLFLATEAERKSKMKRTKNVNPNLNRNPRLRAAPETKTRIGAKNLKSVDKEILRQLNLGTIESANLVEALAIDFDILLGSIQIKAKPFEQNGIVKKMAYYGSKIPNWSHFRDHKSDTVRGLAAYSMAQSRDLQFERKMREILKFADDSHFGVREWAWLAMREQISENLMVSISLLKKASDSSSENVRRFASEALRPRGVWCAHITELKGENFFLVESRGKSV